MIKSILFFVSYSSLYTSFVIINRLSSLFAIWQPSSRLTFYNNACAQKEQIALMEREFGPVVVGEWVSLGISCSCKHYHNLQLSHV